MNIFAKSIRSIMKINHKGSTLLMVIICLAFIGILGSLMLSVSMVNYQMKSVESASRDNFYSCEKALEEIRAGLEVKTIEVIQLQYEEVLKNYIFYAAYDDDSRSAEIQKAVCNNLKSKIVSINLDDFLSSKIGYTINYNSITIAASNDFLLLKDVNIVYLENNFQTSITSDIRITIPNFTLTEGSETVIGSMTQPYAGYALAADGYIKSENSEGTNIVAGNVYAGSGITVSSIGLLQNHTLTMTGNYITTRGDILTKDTATLNIKRGIDQTLLTANNLVVDTSSYLQSITATTLNVNAICLIKDDLTLEGRNSTAVMKGAYIGYSAADTDSAKGSAILVNGAGSSLDLSQLSSLLLAGRAHVSILDNDGGKIVSNIMTGESLSLKSNQRAYLVPGANIYLCKNDLDPGVSANHNPISDNDLIGTTSNLSQKVLVTNDDLKTFLGLTGKKEYLNINKPVQTIKKITTLGNVYTLYYYYLLFASGKMADEYFLDYNYKYNDILQMMDAFPLGNIKVPTNNVYSAGNVMSYNAANSSLSCQSGLSVNYGTDEELNQALQEKKFSEIDDTTNPIFDTAFLDRNYLSKISDIKNLYFNLTHYLSPDKDSRNFEEADEAIRYTLKDRDINQVIAEYAPLKDTILTGTEFIYRNSLPSDSTEKSIIIMNSNINIPDNSCINGLLINSGDITIGKDVVINGLLITAGDITIGTNVVINGLIVAARSSNSDKTIFYPHNVIVGDGTKVYGRIIATGDIILGKNCTIDCNHNTIIPGATSNDTVENFLANIFDKANNILWKLFISSTPQIGIPKDSDSYLVDIKNLVSCENWRRE